MSLAQELVDSDYPNCLFTSRINDALDNHNVQEIAQFIRSNEHFDEFDLKYPPVNEELGRHVSDAIVQSSHIRQLSFIKTESAIRDLVAWIGSHDTLVNMTSLQSVEVIAAYQAMSVLDCYALFPLLLTSRSLRHVEIYFTGFNGYSDDVMSALLAYLGTASLREFEFHSKTLSEAAFTALCGGVASSTVRQFTLGEEALQYFDLEIGAESLARMIVESSLEEVWMKPWTMEVTTLGESFTSALKLTAPVRNMDFAFTQIGDDPGHLRINRKWKPLVSANIPLALWPYILEKSHVSPETSHGSADIVFYLLSEKPHLVPTR